MLLAKYSVLLLYPDWMQETGAHETYFAHVYGCDPDQAVQTAQAQAFKMNEMIANDEYKLSDFICLLVLEGHHRGINFSEMF